MTYALSINVKQTIKVIYYFSKLKFMGVLDRIFDYFGKSIAKHLIKELDRMYFLESEGFIYPTGDTKEILQYISMSPYGASVEDLVAHVKIGERSIRGIIKTLQELGILEVRTSDKGKKIYTISNKYLERIRFVKEEAAEAKQ